MDRMIAREQYAEVLAALDLDTILAEYVGPPVSHEVIAIVLDMVEARFNALAADLPDPEQADEGGSTCPGCTGDPGDHPSDHYRSGPDPEQAVREALDKVLAGYSNTGLMDLWWTASGDDWPVPEDMPRKFLTAIRDREARP